MPWNYRVRFDGDSYEIVEVYYNEDGYANGAAEHEASPYGETHHELSVDIQRMSEALQKPIVGVDGRDLEPQPTTNN